jgi:hypothetical protein
MIALVRGVIAVSMRRDRCSSPGVDVNEHRRCPNGRPPRPWRQRCAATVITSWRGHAAASSARWSAAVPELQRCRSASRRTRRTPLRRSAPVPHDERRLLDSAPDRAFDLSADRRVLGRRSTERDGELGAGTWPESLVFTRMSCIRVAVRVAQVVHVPDHFGGISCDDGRGGTALVTTAPAPTRHSRR